MSESNRATYSVGIIARLLVLTERQVQNLAAQGVLPKAERGRYELASVVQAYVRYLRGQTLSPDGETNDIGPLKARLIKARARVAEAEADQLDSTLLQRSQVEAAWGEMVSNMRARLLGIPNKCAALAQTAPSLTEASAAITAAVHEALDQISRTPVYSGSIAAGLGEGPERVGGRGPADVSVGGPAAKTQRKRMG